MYAILCVRICLLSPVLDQWVKKHGPDSGWQLIEKVDGFHPNQVRDWTDMYMCTVICEVRDLQ